MKKMNTRSGRNNNADCGGRRENPIRQAFSASLLILTAVVLLATATNALAQRGVYGEEYKKQVEYAKANYTKFEYMVPMRDGVKLFTIVYVPKDAGRAYPILLQRTPYSVAPYGLTNYRPVLGPSELCTKEGFIVAYQDVRGRSKSEGEFLDIPVHKMKLSGPKDTDESTDTYDTIDWLVKNIPGNNGAVGMWGISYPGFFAAFSLIDAHPALKAVSPQAPMADVGNGDDCYHNGAFFLAANFGFYVNFWPKPAESAAPASSPSPTAISASSPSSSSAPSPSTSPAPVRPRWKGYGTPDQYDFFLRMGPLANAKKLYMNDDNPYWDMLLSHSTYDEYWRSRALLNYMKGIKPAVLVVGGWYDAEDLGGTPRLFQALNADRPDGPVSLVMGPWTHGGWSGKDDKVGDIGFGSPTGAYYREKIEFPFFMRYLKGQGDGPRSPIDGSVPKAWIFETGKNEWRFFSVWPPKLAREKSLYLGHGGKLSFEPAPGKAGAHGGDFDEYTSDPDKPVPTVGYIGQGMPHDYMTSDQRFASRRPDVLVYETEVLEHDVTIVGPVVPSLLVSTSGTDSDFDVKLIDVYPGNYPDPRPDPAAAPNPLQGPPNVHMGGYQQLVRGEPFRGKFRRDMSKPVPFKPGKAERVEFAMPDICHTFKAGHRIMVQVQSSWFPLTDRNPQKFVDITQAKASDFQKAVERIYRGGKDGSRLKVLVLE